MNRWKFLGLTLFSASSLLAQPKVVVGLVIDQMRADYLLKYKDQFCDSGFKLMCSEGFWFKNARYNYAPTITAPGHASIYTGTTPAYHGIAGNDWFSRQENKGVYCVDDKLVYPLGGSEKQGYSPARLRASTVTDELKLFSRDQSVVIGISIKDRGAILPAGHAADGAYWYDGKTGKLVSSTYYHQRLPNWLDQFNKKGLPLSYLEQVWNPLLPINQYTASSPDLNPAEKSIKDNEPATFPYDLKLLQQKWGYKLLPMTPWGNTFLFEAGKAAMEANRFGEDAHTDFLCLSFSAPDYMGHSYGPQSIEIQDMYLRLDLELAAFLSYLDQKFGKDNYLVFLSADHGGNENIQELENRRIPGGLLSGDSILQYLRAGLFRHYGDGQLALSYYNEQIYLDRNKIESMKLSREEVEDRCREILMGLPGVYKVFGSSALEKGLVHPNSPLESRLLLGFHPTESGDLLIMADPGWMEYGRTGTTHGSPYSYDTNIPLIFYGHGVKKGQSYREVSITDIAPTLSALLGISFPQACIGQVLTEVLKDSGK